MLVHILIFSRGENPAPDFCPLIVFAGAAASKHQKPARVFALVNSFVPVTVLADAEHDDIKKK